MTTRPLSHPSSPPVSAPLSLDLPGLRDPARPSLRLAPGIALTLGRAHELCGPARRSLAAWIAGKVQQQASAPVLWIHPGWARDRLNPEGLRALADPGRFLFVAPPRAEDLLWCAEEALRSGAVSLVVADLPGPPGLTPVRRLHLAAGGGPDDSGHPGLDSHPHPRQGRPLCLLLCPGDGGAPGIESRWHLAPAHRATARRWRLELRRARATPPRGWDLVPMPGGLRPESTT